MIVEGDDQANSKFRKFRYKLLQFEDEFNLFIGNSKIRENACEPMGDELIPSKGPTPDEEDHDTHSEFIESCNAKTNLSLDGGYEYIS